MASCYVFCSKVMSRLLSSNLVSKINTTKITIVRIQINNLTLVTSANKHFNRIGWICRTHIAQLWLTAVHSTCSLLLTVTQEQLHSACLGNNLLRPTKYKRQPALNTAMQYGIRHITRVLHTLFTSHCHHNLLKFFCPKLVSTSCVL